MVSQVPEFSIHSAYFSVVSFAFSVRPALFYSNLCLHSILHFPFPTFPVWLLNCCSHWKLHSFWFNLHFWILLSYSQYELLICSLFSAQSFERYLHGYACLCLRSKFPQLIVRWFAITSFSYFILWSFLSRIFVPPWIIYSD